MITIDLKDEIFQLKSEGKTWNEIDNLLNLNPDQARNLARKDERYSLIKKANPHSKPDEMDKKYYRDDGSITSIIRTKRKKKQTFNQNELLIIHGFNPDEFKICSITSNEWTTPISGESFYNYQSKIVVEPKVKGNSIDDIIQAIKDYTTPFDITVVDDEKLEDTLLINLPDLHFGINTADEYSDYQSKILSYLENQYENVVISLLGDFFNTDNFNNKTIHETRVNDTDIPNAWEEATLFIEPIIQKSLSMSPNVRVVYSRGNHDESMAWAYHKYLEVKYPQAEHDVAIEQLKCILIDKNAIYLTHGHIRKRNICQLCATLYPKEWAEAENRMLFTGHFHTIKSEDLTGLVHYQLPTISKHTDYEKENLFIGSQKGVHLFELGHGRVNAIYYIKE